MFRKIYLGTLRESVQNKVFKIILFMNILLSLISGYTGSQVGMNFTYSTGLWPLFFGQFGVILCVNVMVCRTMNYIVQKNGTFDIEKVTQLDMRVFVFAKYLAYLTIAIAMQIMNIWICIIKTYLFHGDTIQQSVAVVLKATWMKYLFASLPLMIFLTAFIVFIVIWMKSVVTVTMISVVNMVVLTLRLPFDCWYLPTFQMLRMCSETAYPWVALTPPSALLKYSVLLLVLAVAMIGGCIVMLRRGKS